MDPGFSKFEIRYPKFYFVSFVPPLKIRDEGASVSASSPDWVTPAWSAGNQVNMDVSGRILANLDAGYPCRHDEDPRFHVLCASVSS
jgi:hypothetical protein